MSDHLCRRRRLLLSVFEADDPTAVTNTGTWDSLSDRPELHERGLQVGSMRTMHGVRATASFLAGSLTWTRNGLQARILPYYTIAFDGSSHARCEFHSYLTLA